MSKLSPSQIADIVFHEGEWAFRDGKDHSLRRGFQNLNKAGFTAPEIRAHHQMVTFAGVLALAERYPAAPVPKGEDEALQDLPEGAILVGEIPVEFDIEQHSGFRALQTDRLDRLMTQHFLDSVEFRTKVRENYIRMIEQADKGGAHKIHGGLDLSQAL